VFQTSRVHYQEDHLYMQFLYVMFVMHLCKQSSRWKDVSSTSFCICCNLDSFQSL